jgi:hypothetical protein
MFKTSLDIKDAHRRKGKKKGVKEKDKKTQQHEQTTINDNT